MDEIHQNQIDGIGNPNLRWRDLYRIAFISCIVFSVSIVIAVIAYFIWPYSPGTASVAEIFDELQSNRFGGLISLDFMMVVLMPIMILPVLALFTSLKQVNESYALIALTFGLIGSVLIFMGRPLAEMVYLSNQYASETSDMMKNNYLAAGEAFHALFEGTAWMASLITVGISGVINSLLMFQSKFFNKATAYTGLVVSIVGLAFWIPGIGPILSLLATIGGVIWYLLLAQSFFKLGWDRSNASR